jgi:hypothetical protein
MEEWISVPTGLPWYRMKLLGSHTIEPTGVLEALLFLLPIG